MSNRFYQEGAARSAKVQDLFAKIARRYDLINDLQSFGLHRWWKRQLVDWAAPVKGERALDVCCGTGDLAMLLARRGAEVSGVDFSEAMLRIARERATEFEHQTNRLTPHPCPLPVERRGRTGVAFVQADAQALPFPDDSFNIVTVGYGLRNLADWRIGLREMHRVAKPGGRLLVLDFGKPENAVWRRTYFAYLKAWVPLFGKIFCGDWHTYAYILESLNHYPAQAGVAAAMKELGCADIAVRNVLGGIMSINYARKASAA